MTKNLKKSPGLDLRTFIFAIIINMKTKSLNTFLLWPALMTVLMLSSACENKSGFVASSFEDQNNKNTGQGSTTTLPQITTTTLPAVVTTTTIPNTKPPLSFCNRLDFKGTTFPDAIVKANQVGIFSLALDISGSYEGRSGWANLTNNFDGQGLSMGLLNQTLGTGSLQPLLKSMRELYPSQWRAALPNLARRASIESMLNDYYNSALTLQRVNQLSRTDFEDSEFSENSGEGLSIFAVTGSTSASVKWAIKNLYDSNGKFKPEWKAELSQLITTPGYRSLQINAASKIHSSVLKDSNFGEVGVKQLRAYLLIFDLLVQNGSIWKNPPASSGAPFRDMLAEFRNYKSDNPMAPPQALLETVVNLRLWAVRPEYVNDVKSRKYTIINGTGKVHGENRNLETEFCYKGTTAF